MIWSLLLIWFFLKTPLRLSLSYATNIYCILDPARLIKYFNTVLAAKSMPFQWLRNFFWGVLFTQLLYCERIKISVSNNYPMQYLKIYFITNFVYNWEIKGRWPHPLFRPPKSHICMSLSLVNINAEGILINIVEDVSAIIIRW